VEEERALTLPGSKGKYSEIEEAILKYLYEHPDWSIGTMSLVQALKSEVKDEESEKAFSDIQYGVETLIADKLIKGKRVLASQVIQFVQLELTPKGEAEAILQKRRVGEINIISSIPRPPREK
jgi:hypothetical protein